MESSPHLLVRFERLYEAAKDADDFLMEDDLPEGDVRSGKKARPAPMKQIRCRHPDTRDCPVSFEKLLTQLLDYIHGISGKTAARDTRSLLILKRDLSCISDLTNSMHLFCVLLIFLSTVGRFPL
jgi:hypothetical protein